MLVYVLFGAWLTMKKKFLEEKAKNEKTKTVTYENIIPQKIRKYRENLYKTKSIEECEKIPTPKINSDQNFIFISYSHKDYKQVYSDIANLYYSGVSFWYDKGLHAGEVWKETALNRISDPCCCGVIFYISENSFSSKPIWNEIKSVLDNKPYFAVNLTNKLPSDILMDSIGKIKEEKPEDPMEWIGDLTKAFKDSIIYLSITNKNHDHELIEQIKNQFNVIPETYKNK